MCFRTLPGVPESGKWTKTGPCADYFKTTTCAIPLLPAVWHLAFGAFVKAESNEKTEALVVEESWLESVAWREATSKRVKRCGTFFLDAASPALLFIIGIVHEPIRYLTGYFLNAASLARRTNFSNPELCTFANPERSPITQVLQYFSELLSGRGLRLRLLVHLCKMGNFHAWAAAFPNLLAALRRGVSVAASWIYRRIWIEGMCFPWRLVGCADNFLTADAQLAIFKEFLLFPLDRLDPHFSRKFRRFIEARAEGERVHESIINTALWLRRFLLRWSWSVRMTMAMVEFMHGRNRRRCCNGTSWPTFLSDYLLDESGLRFPSASGIRKVETIVKRNDKPKEPRVRKKIGTDVFREEYHATQKAAGGSTQFGLMKTARSWPVNGRSYQGREKNLVDSEPHCPSPLQMRVKQSASQSEPARYCHRLALTMLTNGSLPSHHLWKCGG